MSSNTDFKIQIPEGSSTQTAEFYFHELIETIVQSRWLIAAIVFLFIALGVVKAVTAPRVYKADALLQITTPDVGIGAVTDFSEFSNLFLGDVLESEFEILQSRRTLSQIVDRFKLNISARPIYMPVIGRKIIQLVSLVTPVEKPLFNFGAYAWGGEVIKLEKFDVPNQYLGSEFIVESGREGDYKLLSVDGDSLGEGTVGVSTIIPLSKGQSIVLQISKLFARPGTHFYLKQISHAEAIARFKGSYTVEGKGEGSEARFAGLILISIKGTNRTQIRDMVNEIVDRYVKQTLDRKSSNAETTLKLLKEQLGDVKKQLEESEAALNDYQVQQGSVDLNQETSIILRKIVQEEEKLARLRTERGELMQRFTAEHPKVNVLNSQIAASAKNLKALEAKSIGLPDKQQEMLRISREIKVTALLYTMLSNKAQELDVLMAGYVPNVYVIDEAVIPFKPLSPNVRMILFVYLVLGSLLGVGVAVIRHTYFGGVKDPDLIDRELGLPVYALVPHSKQQPTSLKTYKKNENDIPLLALIDPSDPAIESLRSLRTSLHFAQLEAKNNVIMITSPGPADGKSFICANLSAVLARMGKKVLIIDSDLRRGHIHEYFKVSREAGLSEVISEGVSWEQAIKKTPIDCLEFISTGVIPPNPSELLLHEKFESVIEEISQQYDYVVIDSPPLLPVTDPTVIGKLAGASFLVVKSGKHSLRAIEQGIKRLRQNGINLRGAVLNNIEILSSHYGYGKYYGYSYTYSKDRK